MKIKITEIAIKAGGVSAGAVIAKFADKLVPNLNPKIRGAAKVVIGAVVPAFMPKNKFVDHVGSGMIAVGAIELATEFVPGMAGANEDPMSGIGAGENMAIDEDFEDENLSGSEDDEDDDDMNGANENPMGEMDDDDDDNDE